MFALYHLQGEKKLMKRLFLICSLLVTSIAVAHGPTMPPDPQTPLCATLCFPWILCQVPCDPPTPTSPPPSTPKGCQDCEAQ